MNKTIPYTFYKEIDNIKVYKRILDDKYIVEFKEAGKYISIHFYFDANGNLIIDNIYKSMRNYKAPRYIKKYAENKALINAMSQLK